MGLFKSFIMNSKGFRNLFCNPQKSFKPPRLEIEAVKASIPLFISYLSKAKSKQTYKAKKRNKSVSRDARALLFYGLKSRVAFFFSLYLFLKK